MVSEDVVARVVSYMRHQAAKPAETVARIVADSQGRLLEIFASTGEDTAARSPGAGEWSLHERLRHVVSAEGGVARLVPMLARGEKPQRDGRAGSMTGDAPYATLVEQLRAANEELLAGIRS